MDKHEKNFLGSGWAFPVTFSPGNFQLNLSAYEDNINDSIDIIMKTNKGERCLEPQFGAGLQQFLFRKMDDALKGEICDVVKSALLFNEPRITVTDVKADFIDQQNGRVEIIITYEYNQTNTRHNYVFPFSLNEGTNLRLSANEWN
ncbi:GPW/gp25 family protein [Mucilaginibacter sp. L196]|uniref:GPW/gp25 family protein n=1 Tax=Mucilaginibacter sp. L196 TaxID=1641870 RepID=UPI00131B3638|nr:GPW/gp25 family protein [Mucilaginibacter sp. L196]